MAENTFYTDGDPNADIIANITNALKRDVTSVPSGQPPYSDINLNIAGNFQTGPVPGLNPPAPDFLQSIGTALKNADMWAQDPYKYGRAIDYAAGLTGFQFDRYYTHPSFSKLGYNPRIDIETYYNENSSWWDDFKRAGSSFSNLFWTGFKSPYDFGSEMSAKEMREQMALGMSTRGGPAQFFTNLVANTGFTVGIAAEMIAENYLIAAITAGTGGLAAVPAALAAATKSGMVTKKLYDLTQATKSTIQLVNKFKQANEAREFYKTAKASTGLGKSVFDFLNPLTRTTDYISDLRTGANGFKEMNDFVKTRKAFGAFYRDLREINLVFSESLMEANMARDQNNQETIKSYYEENGEMPFGEKALSIKNKAENVGFATALYNVPIIFFSNRLVFDNIFRGFKSPSLVGEELLSGSKRQLTRKADWKPGQDVYGFLETNAKKQFRDFITKSPYLPWTKKYIVGNLAEGIQEVSQDIISTAADAYYNGIYNDPAAAGFYGVATSVGTAMSDSFSYKGLETFLSGFLTGSIVQGIGAAVHSPMLAPALYKKYMNSDKYKEMTESIRTTEDLVAKAANELLTDPYNNYVELSENALKQRVLASKLYTSQKNNDQLGFQDAKVEMKLEHLHTLASTGKMGLVFDYVDDMLSIDNNELADAYGVKAAEAEGVRQKLNSLRQDALEYQNRYDVYNEAFPNPFDPSKIDKNKQPLDYQSELINRAAYNEAVKDLIMADSLVKSNAQRMESMLNDFVKNQAVKNANATDFSVLMSNTLINTERDVLKNEVAALEAGTPEQKKEARKKQKKLEKLSAFQSFIEDWSRVYDQNRKLLIQKEKSAKGLRPGTIVLDKKTEDQYEIIEYLKGAKSMWVMDEEGEINEIKTSQVIPISKSKIVEKRIGKANANLYKSFLEYLQTLNEITDSGVLNDKAVQEGYSKLRDHLTLQNEQNYLFKALNILNNPEMLMSYARRKSEEHKVKQQNFAEYIRSGYRKLAKVYKDNIFLNNLYARKAAIDPEDAEKILKKGDFTDVTIYDFDSATPISKDDPRWADIEKFIEQYKKAIEEDLKPLKTKKEVKGEKEEKEAVEETYSQELQDKLLDLIKKENIQRRKLKEALLEEDLENDATKRWLSQSDNAQDLITQYTTGRKSVAKLVPKKETDWVPPAVPKGLEELKALFKELWVLNSTGDYYINKQGQRAFRVSDLKVNKYAGIKSEIGELAGERGSVMDDVIRAFVDEEFGVELVDGKASPESINILKERIEEYSKLNNTKVTFSKTAISDFVEILSDIKTFAEENDLTIYGSIPPIVGKLGKDLYGGTMDLLAKNNKTGEYFILDVKTNSESKSRRSKAGINEYRLNDTVQLNAYAELLKKITGVEVKGIYILPIMVEHGGVDLKTYRNVTGMTLDVDEDADGLESVLIPISMEKSIYELDKDLGVRTSRKRTLKETRGAKLKPSVETEFDSADKSDLRASGFTTTIGQKEGDVIKGMTYFGVISRVTIDILDDGDIKVTAAYWKDDTRTEIDKTTLESIVTDDMNDAVSAAMQYATAFDIDVGFSEQEKQKELWLSKVANINTKEDYFKFEKSMEDILNGKNSTEWLSKHMLKATQISEILKNKAKELGVKPSKKIVKDSDTKKKSDKSIKQTEDKDKAFVNDILSDSKTTNLSESGSDFIESIC